MAEHNAGRFYLDVILKSAGVAALNRLHSRTFTENILFTNAKELSQLIDMTENADFMMQAFYIQNEEASKQIHRESSRIVHNYLCSISTFIDHSRNFMNEHYRGTAFYNDYSGEIQKRFHSSELARFVRDLRNYMTHRELPDSQMTLKMVATGAPATDEGTPCDITAGIQYKTTRFLEWDGWSAPAARFLKTCDEFLTLRSIFEPHITLMQDFSTWFEDRFRQHHHDDFKELQALEEQHEALEAAEGYSSPRQNR
ncbi:hypothetical protein B5M44_23840 [Shinella sumterensis]|uniref:hypothetical protein n=1 Tax=Shinella sumterensis TaxID=1967501 RepID=UPI00106E2001|nr:hypothetical protein [Shinella sumterensis]MCD1267106.1 hypothetical protein [Shinella sumterensis]TFE94133.1 hypothetical protein B5M44_23840 [Shinella sumterensis]